MEITLTFKIDPVMSTEESIKKDFIRYVSDMLGIPESQSGSYNVTSVSQGS